MILPVSQQSDLWLLVRAKAHLYRRADVLADFEAELITEAFGRVVLDGGPLTPAERQVVEAALEAMILAPRQDLTSMGQAA